MGGGNINTIGVPFGNYRPYYIGSGSFSTFTATKPTRLLMFLGNNQSASGHYYTTLQTGTEPEGLVHMRFNGYNLQNTNFKIMDMNPNDVLTYDTSGSWGSAVVNIYISELESGVAYKGYAPFTELETVTFPTKFSTFTASKTTRVYIGFGLSQNSSCSWHVETKDGVTNSFSYQLTTAGKYYPDWEYILYKSDKLICDTAVDGGIQYTSECTIKIGELL